jgi:TetR/AcrR family transcriptional regulator
VVDSPHVDSRSKILDAAARLFARQGFAGVSLQAIAERVGITKPSLLYHFPSKEQLREEVLRELFAHWATRIPNLLRAVATGEGQFEALMDELSSFFREDPNRARLIIREIMDRPDEMRASIASSLGPLVTLIADTMRKGQSAGLLRQDVDPEAYVLNAINVAMGLVVAASVVEPIIGSEGNSAITRLEKETRRIARSSLFSDLGSEAPQRRSVGPARPSAER